MRVARAQKIIGIADRCERKWRRFFAGLGFDFKNKNDDLSSSTRRPIASIIEIEEDLIEEVARVHGFERIPAHAAARAGADARAARGAALAARAARARRRLRLPGNHQLRLRRARLGGGFRAARPSPVRLLNPIASQASVMRTTLIGSLVANVRATTMLASCRASASSRSGASTCATRPRPTARCRWPACASRCASAARPSARRSRSSGASAARAVDFYDVKADLEALCAPRRLRFEPAPHPALHPGRSARVLVDGAALRRVAGRAASALAAEVRAAAAGGAVRAGRRQPRRGAAARARRSLRASRRWCATSRCWSMPAVPAQALLDAAAAEKPAIVRDVTIFDLYQGPNLPAGRKSLAFRVVMQDTERTLTDVEADSARDALVATVGAAFRRHPAVIIRKLLRTIREL